MTHDELFSFLATALTDKDFAEGFHYGQEDYQSERTYKRLYTDDDILGLIRRETAPVIIRGNPALNIDPPPLRSIFGFLVGWLLAGFTDTEEINSKP